MIINRKKKIFDIKVMENTIDLIFVDEKRNKKIMSFSKNILVEEALTQYLKLIDSKKELSIENTQFLIPTHNLNESLKKTLKDLKIRNMEEIGVIKIKNFFNKIFFNF